MLWRLKLIFLVLFLTHSAHANTILFIGDSHVAGPFGHTLDEKLRTLPDTKVESYGICGSTALYFTHGGNTKCGYFTKKIDGSTTDTLKGPAPLITSLLTELKPDQVVIELGSNYATGWEVPGMIADMASLAKAATSQGAKCTWISMPDTRKFKAQQKMVLQATVDAVAPYCNYIDSTLLTEYPATGGDGLHYEAPNAVHIAVNWAKQVFRYLQK